MKSVCYNLTGVLNKFWMRKRERRIESCRYMKIIREFFRNIVDKYVLIISNIMKTIRSNFVGFAVLVSMIISVFCLDARAEVGNPAPVSSQWTVAIFLPDIAAGPELNTDNWLNLADLPMSSRPDNSYQGFRLPNINAIYTWHKSVIETLTAKCDTIVIDYKDATSADLSALLVAIGICGPQARVVTTSALIPGTNPALISAGLIEFVALAKAAGYDKQ